LVGTKLYFTTEERSLQGKDEDDNAWRISTSKRSQIPINKHSITCKFLSCISTRALDLSALKLKYPAGRDVHSCVASTLKGSKRCLCLTDPTCIRQQYGPHGL
jgi:hypothetical protein